MLMAADSAIKSAKRTKITGELIIPSTNGEQINKLIIKGFLNGSEPKRLSISRRIYDVKPNCAQC